MSKNKEKYYLCELDVHDLPEYIEAGSYEEAYDILRKSVGMMSESDKLVISIMDFLYSLSGDISFEKRLINENLRDSDLKKVEEYLDSCSLKEINKIIKKLKSESCYENVMEED